MNFPVITDPLFYALAVPAVILLGLAKSGFLSGFGSLATPLPDRPAYLRCSGLNGVSAKSQGSSERRRAS